MNTILAIPLAIRLLGLALAGAGLGALVNWAVDRVRWQPSFISPWNRHPHTIASRTGDHFIPVWGWLARRAEVGIHGRGFWIRPALVEIGMLLVVPSLYWYETAALALVPAWPGKPAAIAGALHAAYLSHLAFLTVALIASLVDLDDKIIPDAITVPGTCIALALAALLPWSALPEVIRLGQVLQVRGITLSSPHDWPASLDGPPGFVLAVASVWIWCIGLMPRVWRLRRGWPTAFRLFFGRLSSRASLYLLLLGLLLSAGVVGVRQWDAAHWRTFLSALAGMAITGGFTWAVRFVASASIGREALGFGDVTLMAMVGAFFGWQVGLMVFFLAPFLGLFSGLLRWVLRRDPEIPYGPFLCLATFFIVLLWPAFWDSLQPIFLLGWLVPGTLAVTVLLMGAMLRCWHWLLGHD